jgi:hypothetical protein
LADKPKKPAKDGKPKGLEPKVSLTFVPEAS